jgi:flagellin
MEAHGETQNIGENNMSLNISTNTAALRAGSYLSKNNSLLQKSLDRLASGKKISSPVDDPGSLAVSMKLNASINRLAGAQNNSQNALSFLEVQDGMLDTVGQIIDRMSELKGLASQDPMKGEQDRASYNNEFKDLQVQLYNISQQTFNGVSLFANHTNGAAGVDGTEGFDPGTGTLTEGEAVFGASDQSDLTDATMSIFTSGQGSGGSKVSVHKALLLSALTLKSDGSLASKFTDADSDGRIDQTNAIQGDLTSTNARHGLWSNADNSIQTVTGKTSSGAQINAYLTFAVETVDDALELDQISVGVITQALENISFLRAQNGGTQSRLTFNIESLNQQKTNMRAALGRVVDTDIAEESTNLAKYSILNQAAASMLAQANASMDVALMLLR